LRRMERMRGRLSEGEGEGGKEGYWAIDRVRTREREGR
jgi:hypothetical protein